MKKKDLVSLRSKEGGELKKLVFEKKLSANKIKIEIASGKEKNLRTYKNLRREVAQIMTIIKEKQILTDLAKKGEVS